MKCAIVWVHIALLAACSAAFADDSAWSEPYQQWKTAMEKAEQRAHGSKAAEAALSDAERPRYEIERLASSLKERSSEIDSAKFQAKFYKEEFESAKRDADRADQQLDAKAKQLREDFARLSTDSDALDARSAKLKQWNQRLETWRAGIESRRHVFQLPQEQGALDAFNADVNSFNADKDRYNAERASIQADIDKWNNWRSQLLAIEKLITEDGRHVLQLRQVESKKEREYAEKQQKLEKLTASQDEEAGKLAALLGPSLAALEGIVEAMDAPAPVSITAPAAGQPYVAPNEPAAQAVALSPAVTPGPSGDLRDRIFILPSSGASASDSQTQTIKRRLSVELAADSISNQYANVPVNQTAPAPAPAAAADLNTNSLLPVTPPAQPDPTAGAASVLHDSDVVPALDPRRFITRDDYESALAARQRLTDLLSKLQSQLEKVKAQRGNTLEYQAEFEAIRAEAARGALRDALGVLPVSAMLKRLAAMPRFANSLTPETISRVELAMKAVRTEITREHAPLAPEPEERRKLRAETIRQGAEALLSACATQLPDDGASRLMLEQMGKMLQVYGKFSDYLNDPKAGERPPWQEAGEVLKLGIDVAGVYCAPVALGAGIESLGERAATRIIIRSAMEDLSDSLKSSYDAERFLSEKMDRTKGFVDELDRTVTSYEAVHQQAKQDPPAGAPPGDNQGAP